MSKNLGYEFINEMSAIAPNILSLLIKLCCKPNTPLDLKVTRKILTMASQIFSSVNQKNSTFQKLIAMKLKLSNLTNAGVDFLSALGLLQSSRSWELDSAYLASISKEIMLKKIKDRSFSFLVDNLDKIINGELVHFTSVMLVADRSNTESLSEQIDLDRDFFNPSALNLDNESMSKYMEAVVYILGKCLTGMSTKFSWIKDVLPENFVHSQQAHILEL